MKKITFRFLFLSLIIILYACSNNKTNIELLSDFEVIGEISNAPKNTYIKLARRNSNNTKIVDSCLIIDSKFELSAELSEKPEFYLLSFTNNNYNIFLLVDTNNTIEVNADFRYLQKYIVSNSEESQKIQILENRLYKTNADIDSLVLLRAEQFKIDSIAEAQRKFSLEFIIQNSTSLTSIIAFSQRFSNGQAILTINDADYLVFKKVKTDLKQGYPNSEYYKLFADFVTKYEKQREYEQSRNENNTIANTLINFNTQTIDDKKFELKTLSGSWILLNFWASWSRTCSENNIFLAKIQEKYSINIVQVSIDKKVDILKDTISKYQFNRILINESDGWKSEIIKKYNIKTLPTNILINPSDEIVYFGDNTEELEKIITDNCSVK